MAGEPPKRRPVPARRERGLSRRRLFAAASVAGAAGWAVTRRGGAATVGPARRPSAGYRETEHVRTAYRLSRF